MFSDVVTLFNHIRGHSCVVTLILKDVLFLFSNHVSIEGNGPFTLSDEVNLGNITLLLNDVTVFSCSLIMSWHEAESNLVDKVALDFRGNCKEGLKCWLLYNVLEQKHGHNFILNLERNCVEILTFF